jgi:hypothetical protein
MARSREAAPLGYRIMRIVLARSGRRKFTAVENEKILEVVRVLVS